LFFPVETPDKLFLTPFRDERYWKNLARNTGCAFGYVYVGFTYSFPNTGELLDRMQLNFSSKIFLTRATYLSFLNYYNRQWGIVVTTFPRLIAPVFLSANKKHFSLTFGVNMVFAAQDTDLYNCGSLAFSDITKNIERVNERNNEEDGELSISYVCLATHDRTWKRGPLLRSQSPRSIVNFRDFEKPRTPSP
jgi:hypothetical protein